jgi:threonine/homoserine/homoserine lactone efflux protein
VTSAALYLIPFALVAAASPLGLAATLTVLRTGRVQALVLAIGVIGGQLFACAALVLIGAASISHRTKRPNVEGVLELLVGVALLLLAVRLLRRPKTEERTNGRSQRFLDRLGQVRLKTDFVAGLALGIGGPKRLVLTALAASSITAAGVDGAEETALVLWYCGLATVVVWAPVLAALLLGDPAVDLLDRGFAWLARHQRAVTLSVLLVVGLFFFGHGLGLLVTQS